MPDSLEIPDNNKEDFNYTKAKILSKSLESTLYKLQPAAISKAFPNWNKADSIKSRTDGAKIRTPQFDRIFNLTFKTESEANAAIEILKKNSAILFAEKNSKPQLHSDPEFLNGTQWHLNNDGRNGGVVGADINAIQAWNIFTGSNAVTIAVFDTGLELSHDELTGKSSGDPSLSGTNAQYHGTHVAGIAAANAFNVIGGRGVDWNARLLSKRIFEPSGYIGDANVAQKIIDAVNAGAQISNHSWGGSSYSTTIAMAFAYSYKMNSTSIVSMGNNNGNTTQYPAGNNNLIAVGATQNNDQHSLFSNTGNHIDVCAPGGITNSGTDPRDIRSSALNNTYEFHAGTSQAAPQVAGIASLLKGFRPNLFNDDIENIIKISADEVGNDPYTNGFNNTMGHGRVNAAQALTLLQQNAVNHYTATGGTVASSTGNYSATFYSTLGLAAGNYVVKRHEVIKAVTFPYSFCNVLGAWGRGVGTSGLSVASPNYGEGFCEIVPGTLTNTGATLRTYVYEVYNILGQQIGFYPTTPANVTFAYSVLGNADNYTIQGSNLICNTSETYTIQNLPAGATFNWTANLPSGIVSSSTSGNSITLTKVGNGQITLTATVTTACGNINLTPKIIGVGAPILGMPNFTNLDNQNPYWCSNNTGNSFTIETNDLSATYEARLLAYPSLNLYATNNNAYPGNDVFGYVPAGYYVFQVRAISACGTSDWVETEVESLDCSWNYRSSNYNIYPNPANNELNIEFQNYNNARDIQLLNNKGDILISSQIKKGDKKSVLSTKEIPNGTYYLHINEGKETVKKQIIIKH
ncbi:S8 family serine peptidase [Pedobacter alpinus]|uniref:S8 family serine peptidase n=1 Tax=Pedobacter alpinus TaxID=1590643 RepID=A0ABW5TN13_9SPHI